MPVQGFVQLVPGLLLSVANISENPTHYGNPSWVNGACKSDEDELSWHGDLEWGCGDGDDGCALCSFNLHCDHDSDCPQDKPPNTKGSRLARICQHCSGHDLALTPGAFAPPCCLPGMFENITVPTGACHGTTPNICNSTAARVGA